MLALFHSLPDVKILTVNLNLTGYQQGLFGEVYHEASACSN